MAVRPKEIIAEVIAEKGAWLIEIETVPDQVHPAWRKWIRSSRSTNWWRPSGLLVATAAPGDSVAPASGAETLRTNSHFVATVDEARLSVMKCYVENQKSR
jgi:REP-associated tyrosine transposase